MQAESPLSDAERRRLRNCDGDTNPSAKLRACPWSSIDEWTWMAIGWWLTWSAHQQLPYAGTLAEQPAYVEEALSLCAQVEAEAKPAGG